MKLCILHIPLYNGICIIYNGEIKITGTLEELKDGSQGSLEDIFLSLTGGEKEDVETDTEA